MINYPFFKVSLRPKLILIQMIILTMVTTDKIQLFLTELRESLDMDMEDMADTDMEAMVAMDMADMVIMDKL